MGLLDQVIGSVLGGALGGGRDGGRSGGMSPIVQAILMLLAQKALQGGLGGGLGDILGGGRHAPAPEGPGPQGASDDEDDQPPPRRMPGDVPGRRGGGGQPDFSDLAGGLDPAGGGGPGRDAGAGPYAQLDREPAQEPAGGGDGLGDLLDRFRRGGYGEVLESWIGGGANRAIAPNQLADALGSETIATLAQHTGLNRDDLLGQLSQVLPGVIDKLTPHGRMPTQDERHGW